MHGLRSSNSLPSLPPPRPKSPPEYPDLYGKRREMAKLQVLEREIGFLEEEVKSVEGLEPASKSCKEVADFVTCNADPLIPSAKKTRRSRCFWKWLCQLSCFNISWMCHCCCSSKPEKPRHSSSANHKKPTCCGCTLCSCSNPCPSCGSCCGNSQCFNECKCSWSCCKPSCPSCLSCSTRRCRCYPKCPKVNVCACCNKTCCYSCCFFC